MASVAGDASAFAAALAGLTGLDTGVLLAWMASENNIGQPKFGGDDGSTGAFENWLNIGVNGPVYRGSNLQAWTGTPQQAAQATDDFIHGKFSGWGLGSIDGPGILASAKQGVQAQLAAIQNCGWISGTPGVASYPNLLTDYNLYKGTNLPAVASLTNASGTTGTSAATKSGQTTPFYVGGLQNPSEDVWTAVNRLAQARYWYLFSDGETVYLTDGTEIMKQPPALTLDRWGDLDRIVSLTFNYDNSAFQFAADHKRRKHVVRRTQLSKVASPVEAELNVICKIDEVRAGDVVYLTGCGPGDGKWLVGTVRRSIFDIFSELTLVPAVRPLSEAQAVGSLNAQSNSDTTGLAAAQTPGTIMHALIATAESIAKQGIPYVSGGGHAQAGTPDQGRPGGGFYDGTTRGFDAAGAIAADFSGAGLFGGAVPDPLQIVAELVKKGVLQTGRGSGVPEYSLFYNGQYFFAFMNGNGTGHYWGTADGGGAQKVDPFGGSNILQGTQFSNFPTLSALPSFASPGGTWLNAPPSLSGYQTWHVPQNILGDLISNTSSNALPGSYTNPFGKAHIVTRGRIDMGVDYTLSNGDPILALGDGTITSPASSIGQGGVGWPGNSSTDGGWIAYSLANGPYQGKHVYVAEGVRPTVSVGTKVTAGQQIATYIANNSNLETGWSSGVGSQPLAQALGEQAPGDPGGWSSAAGYSFNKLLVSLGCPSGNPVGNGQHGNPLPNGYPGAPWGQ